MDLEEAMRGKRSVRSYKAEPAPMELVRKVLEAGTWAPAAKNGQQWRFTVLMGESKRRLTEAMRDGLEETAKGISKGEHGLKLLLLRHHGGGACRRHGLERRQPCDVGLGQDDQEGGLGGNRQRP